jgi:anthranilate/para-aminobenzoate synthase component II
MKINTSCIIIDYDDSFTFNIANQLKLLNVDSTVIHYSKLPHLSLIHAKKIVLIHGPGPGHPDEYHEYFDLIQGYLNSPFILNVGICLGHQIFHTLWGHKISHAKKPVHGESYQIEIPHWDMFDRNTWGKSFQVQRYNSLVVQSESIIQAKESHHQHFVLDGEITMSQFTNGFSYQFHPESIGTSCPSVFFYKIVQFLL